MAHPICCTFLLYLACSILKTDAQYVTPQETNNNLEDASDKFSLHADIPFLQKSHHRIWYIWLVIAIVGAATCCSTGVVIAGLVKWRRRRRQLKLLREEGKLPKGGLEAAKLHGLTKADMKGAPLKIFTPADTDVEKLDKFYKGPQEELWAEKCRRTAKHDKPLHTLQTLHRMKSF